MVNIKPIALHTTTPWMVVKRPAHYDIQNEWYTLGETSLRDDAEFIVKAVNCHEELLSLLEDVINQVDSDDYSGGISNETYNKIRIALLKATICNF